MQATAAGRQVAVHAEDRVGHDHLGAVTAGLHLAVERSDVAVGENLDVGARQAGGIDQAGVIEPIREKLRPPGPASEGSTPRLAM